MQLAIFDYGAGNLHSLAKALSVPGVTVAFETDPHALLSADVVVLPGVGAFGATDGADDVFVLVSKRADETLR